VKPIFREPSPCLRERGAPLRPAIREIIGVICRSSRGAGCALTTLGELGGYAVHSPACPGNDVRGATTSLMVVLARADRARAELSDQGGQFLDHDLVERLAFLRTGEGWVAEHAGV